MKLKGAAFLLLLLVLILAAPSFSANVSGSAYSWENLEPLKSVIVEINSTPVQRMVSADGTYSFQVPAGAYMITGKSVRNGEVDLADEVAIDLSNDARAYRLDLVLFPPGSPLPEKMPELDLNVSGQGSPQEQPIPWAAVAALILMAALAAFLMLNSKAKRPTKETSKAKVKRPARQRRLSIEEKEIVGIMTEAGGRIIQRELRRRLPYSEAKASLVISELESRGIIRKYKRGRANLLVLPRSRG